MSRFTRSAPIHLSWLLPLLLVLLVGYHWVRCEVRPSPPLSGPSTENL